MNKIRFLFFSVVIVFIPGDCFSQADELKQHLLSAKEDTNKVELLLRIGKISLVASYFDSTLKYTEKSLVLAKKLGYIRGEANAIHLLGRTYSTLGKEKEAMQYEQKALKLRQSIHDLSG